MLEDGVQRAERVGPIVGNATQVGDEGDVIDPRDLTQGKKKKKESQKKLISHSLITSSDISFLT